MKTRGKPRLLFLNEYYWPGVEATAHLLTELCEALAAEYDVTVVTGALQNAPQGGTSVRNGVTIVRVRSTAFERRRLALRALNYFSYVWLALGSALHVPRPTTVVCMTDPPFLGAVAYLVARRFRVPLVVISEDVFPEIAVQLGRLRNPVVVGVLGALVRFYLRRADRVVAIGATMRERLEVKGVLPARIDVIPNWVDVDAIVPRSKRNVWAGEKGLSDNFVVMHSGNVGYAQDLDSLLRAATFLRDLDDLKIVVIGSGARHAELVALAHDLDLDNVRFLPYQPREALSETLSTGDVHVVGLARGLSGFVVPSRLYGVLAAGRPVIVSADPTSETARVVEETGCGIVVPPGRPLQLAVALRNAHDGLIDLDEMGRRARAYAEEEAAREVALARYRRVLERVSTTVGAQ